MVRRSGHDSPPVGDFGVMPHMLHDMLHIPHIHHMLHDMLLALLVPPKSVRMDGTDDTGDTGSALAL